MSTTARDPKPTAVLAMGGQSVASILEVGTLARAALQAWTSGIVLATHSHGAVLAAGEGLCWIDDRPGALGRAGLTLAAGWSSARRVPERAGWHLGDDVLVIEKGPNLRLAGAACVEWPPLAQGIGDPAEGATSMAMAMAMGDAAELLGVDPASGGILEEFTLREEARFLEAVQGGETFAVSAAPLVGLGPGLTPSGDDFLGGFWLARLILGEVTPLDEEQAASIAQTTTPVGKAALTEHLMGYATRAEGALLGALASAIERPGVEAARGLTLAAEDVTRFGASSGRDLLRGIHAALTLARP